MTQHKDKYSRIFDKFDMLQALIKSEAKDTRLEFKADIKEIKEELKECVKKEDFKNLKERVGAIEKKIWLWAGSIGAITFLLTYIIKGITN